MGKKFVSYLLGLTLTLFSFPACALILEPDSSSNSSSSSSSASDAPTVTPPEDTVFDDLSIHFLYQGNAVSGDCTLIKVGNTEVLIDAGSTTGSAATIVPYIREYCTDGVLEYVIATHAHEDHIAAFVGGSSGVGVFESFACGTVIDYTGKNTTSQISKDYEALRDREVAAGAKHYTALQCWNNADGASRSYELGAGVTMNILYQKYYEQSASKENNYSVCMLLSQGEKHYLFTGDLEESGEKSLAESNDLPECVLYKGGHHGSNTSSCPELLSEIKPEIVCVCSCCGDKHGFPHQEFIDNVSAYTDKVYITAVNKNGSGVPLNGNIVVTATEEGVTVNCSNNNTLFKDTEWFKANRVCPDAWKQTAGE